MMFRFGLQALLLLLSSAAVAVVHGETAGTTDTWLADAWANQQAQKAAEKAALQARPSSRANGKDDAHRPPPGEGGPGGARGRPPSGGGADGGMAGGPGDGKGGPGGPPGGGGNHAGGQASAADMLRPEMAFAAPVKGELVMYRTRESVLFGRDDGEPVILPLSGDAVAIAPGVTASAREQDGRLHVEMATSHGIRVSFDYDTGPGTALVVDVHAEGPLPHPASRFDVVRRYAAARQALKHRRYDRQGCPGATAMCNVAAPCPLFFPEVSRCQVHRHLRRPCVPSPSRRLPRWEDSCSVSTLP